MSALAIVVVSAAISFYSGIYLIGILTFSITLSIVAPFFDTPSLKKSGKIVYYSPLFLAEKPENGIINIHGGTLFDYFFVIDKKMNGKQRTDFILQQYLSGLLSFLEEYQNNNSLKIRGTSYIINERTAEKMGFTLVETDFSRKMILAFNYFNVLLSNSMAKNKLSFPNLNKTKTFEADIQQLLERKNYIEKLNQLLENKTKTNLS